MRSHPLITVSFILSACGAEHVSSDASHDVVADTAATPSTSPIGTNLTGIADWSTEWAFVDAFKASRAWISGTQSQWDDGRALDLDPDGWVRSLLPGQIARTLLLPDGHYPAGRYVVLYNGQGTLEYGGGAVLDTASSTPGRDVVIVSGMAPVIMNVTATTPGNHLRDIRFLMPGGVCSADPFTYCDDANPCGTGACERFEDIYATQVFHPTFLSRLRGYRTLRFMDWLQTNNSPITSWGTGGVGGPLVDGPGRDPAGSREPTRRGRLVDGSPPGDRRVRVAARKHGAGSAGAEPQGIRGVLERDLERHLLAR